MSLIHISFEEVATHVGHKVLMKVDDNILPIVGDPLGILDQQLRPRIIHFLNIMSIKINYIKVYIFEYLLTKNNLGQRQKNHFS
jgi:hypothetical protein